MPDFDWYALPGDIVDKAIYSNFLGILPPAYMEAGYLQVGEALEHLPVPIGNRGRLPFLNDWTFSNRPLPIFS